MNSLGIDTKEVRVDFESGGLNKFIEILPDVHSNAEFTNCFYVHDKNDSSQISIGTVNITNVRHYRVKDIKKEYPFELHSAELSDYQIVTLVEYEPKFYF